MKKYLVIGVIAVLAVVVVVLLVFFLGQRGVQDVGGVRESYQEDSLMESVVQTDDAEYVSVVFSQGRMSPNRVSVRAGAVVQFEFVADDGDYLVTISDWGVAENVLEGGTHAVSVEPQPPGQVAVFCGEGCFGVIVIESN